MFLLDERTISSVNLIETMLKGGIVVSVQTSVTFHALVWILEPEKGLETPIRVNNDVMNHPRHRPLIRNG